MNFSKKKFFYTWIIVSIYLFIYCFDSSCLASVQDPIYDELEGIHLIKQLILDQRFDLAEQEINKTQLHSTDFLVQGDFYAAQNRWDQALFSYKKAPHSLERQLKMAQASYGKNDFNLCDKYYQESGLLWRQSEKTILQKSRCEFVLQKEAKAWDSLQKGQNYQTSQNQKESFPIFREQMALLLKLSLPQTALKIFFSKFEGLTTDQLQNIFELFKSHHFTHEGLALIELAQLLFPHNLSVFILAAQTYYEIGAMKSVLYYFKKAALLDPKYYYHVAEFHRLLGEHQQSAYASLWINNINDKFRLRLTSYVNQSKYPLIASLKVPSQLEETDDSRYARAYALLKQGEFTQSFQILNQIRKAELLPKVAQLKNRAVPCQLQIDFCFF
ncbi:MAG: hypothetical protein K1X29_09825 [Bdellovibrionales bacterium]|nr:hypothetical protein [Bdellovibrionales bacterium]